METPKPETGGYRTEGALEKHEFRPLVVYRVRHGETSYREHTEYPDKPDSDLTDEGKQTIRTSAGIIAKELDPERDVVLLATSPRIRAQDSAREMKAVLEDAGFEVLDEMDDATRGRSIQPRIRAVDLKDGTTETVVPPQTEEHAKIFHHLNNDVPDFSQMRHTGELKTIEHPHDIEKRTTNHLTALARFAKGVKPPDKNKRYVVFEFEHEETLNGLMRQVSDDERSMAKETGPAKGEVLKLTIGPTQQPEANQHEVTISTVSLNAPTKDGGVERKEYPDVTYDYLDREFR